MDYDAYDALLHHIFKQVSYWLSSPSLCSFSYPFIRFLCRFCSLHRRFTAFIASSRFVCSSSFRPLSSRALGEGALTEQPVARRCDSRVPVLSCLRSSITSCSPLYGFVSYLHSTPPSFTLIPTRTRTSSPFRRLSSLLRFAYLPFHRILSP